MTTIIAVALTISSAISILASLPLPITSRVPISAVTNIIIVVGSIIATVLHPPLDLSLVLWLVITLLATSTVGGNHVVELAITLSFPSKPSEQEAPHAEDHPAILKTSFPATRMIGAVERFGFTVALMLDLVQVAAILLGVKALGQYISNSNRVPAQRVLGTLLSVSWALLCFSIFVLGYPSLFH